MAISLFSKLAACLAVLSFPQVSLSLGKTDTITWGGDVSRTGYETTHNLDPQTVSSSDFGNIWTAKLPGNFNGIGAEKVLSQPLVYTTGDGIQYVFVATTQNNLYKINAKTGDVVKTRNIGVPFLTADIGGCNDIFPAVGVSGTGVIDPATGLWYLTAKTYAESFQTGNFGPSNPPGRPQGRYYFHAISTEDLSEAPNFPTPVHQTPFRNNKNRWLVAGDQHQRPALLQVGDYIYTGWASHCIQYNYTGAIIGFHKTSGAIVESYAMQGGLEPNTVPGGGVWMSGGGLAYDGAGSMFFSTGNGYASQLPATGHPVSGRNVPTALEEAVVHMNIASDGTLSPVDFFMPWEKTQLDGADKDLGTTPFQLLPSAFSCPNDRRVGVITGKSGKTYFLNADNLGGYQQGANRLDDAIFVYQNENSVYSAAGVMPLGKYIYINVINYQTRVFQWSCDASGNGAVTEVTRAAEKNAQPIGVGHGTTTSVDGRDGTGLYWMTDVEGPKLRVYDSTPPTNGDPLKLLRAFNFGNPGKFAHPVFGDGKAYIGATGALYAFGSPVNLPLNCTGPINFAKTSVNGSSDAQSITCTANVATQVTSFNVSGSTNFALVRESLPTLPLTLAAGKQFAFQAHFTPKAVGPLSSDVIIATSNAAAGSSSTTPVTLSGTSNSAAGLFAIQPITLSFNTTVGAGEVQKSAFFNNDGDMAVTVSNIQFSVVSETGPWIDPVTTDDGKQQVAQFTFSNLPSTIPANTRQTVGISYNPPSAGNHAVFVKVTTTGGTKLLDVFGATGSTPSALFEFQKPDGSGWVQYVPGGNFSFGNVVPGQVLTLQMRITNNGSNTASPLGLTVSKPPFGVTGFVKAANSIDLAEGTQIAAGQSATANVFCAPPERQVNTPDTQASAPWRINTNSDQGAVLLNFVCNAAAPQVGPLLNNGSAQHSYIGCYADQTPGRQLSSMAYGDDNNAAGRCITQCATGGYNFTGLIFARECWCGYALPLKRGTSDDCNSRCTGDSNHTCGGDGVQHGGSFIDLFADTSKWDGVLQGPALAMTQSSGDYKYAGCYAETNGKTFNTKTRASNLNTIDSCRQFCAGSQLFGLQYGAECYCGSTIAATSTLTDDSQCGMTCKGNNSQYCGAGSRMQVYRLGAVSSSSSSSASSSTSLSSSSASVSTTASSVSTLTSVSSTPTPTPTPVPEFDGVSARIGSFKYQGCYNEVGGRALTGISKNDATMTNRICAAYCASYSYFATEYSTECYCGNALNANSLPVTDKRCNMPCKANSTEICGGPNGLTLFKLDLSASSSSSLSSSVSSTISSSTSSTISSSATSTTSSASSAVSSDSSSVTSSTSSSISSSVSSSTISATSSSTSVSASSSVSSSTPVTTSSSTSLLVSSSTSTVASTTSSQLPVTTPLKCPGDNGATYVSNSQTFLVECGKDYAGNDIKGVGVTANDLNACINICATTAGCKSVALSGAACYLKSGVGTPNNNGVWGARVIAVAASSSTTSSSITTSASSSSFVTSTISPTSSSTPSLSSSSTLSSTVSSSSSTAAVTSTSVSTSSSSSSSSAPSSTSLSSSASSTPIPSSTSSSSSSASSTPMVTPSSSSASSSTPTPTPTPSSATPTGPIVAPTASIYYSLGCYSEPSGGRALSEVYANNTMTVEMCAAEAQKRQYDYMGVEYGTECWMGDSFNTTASPQQAQSKCNMLCPGNKLNYCGAGGTLQMYMLNSTLATPRTEVPAGQALACPANDDQAWTASTGARFRIECGWDRNGGASSRVTVSSYESCLETCAKTTGCGSVALSGTDCYIKTGTLGARVKKDGIRGGTLLKK